MKNRILSFYDWFLIIGVIVSNLIYSLLSGSLDLMGSIASVAGVLCVVLVGYMINPCLLLLFREFYLI